MYKIFAYVGPHNPEILEFETEDFEEALNEMRKEWGYPMRLELPNGTNYNFPKGGEWDKKQVYNFYVLRTDKENFTPNQNFIYDQLSKSKEWEFIKLWKNNPIGYQELVSLNDEDGDFFGYFAKLLYYDLLERVLSVSGCGFLDPRFK